MGTAWFSKFERDFSDGVFMVLGGVKTSPQTDAFDWGTVSVFDPKEGKWYDQETTGNTPLARKEFCTTGLASDNKTYEMCVFPLLPSWDFPKRLTNIGQICLCGLGRRSGHSQHSV